MKQISDKIINQLFPNQIDNFISICFHEQMDKKIEPQNGIDLLLIKWLYSQFDIAKANITFIRLLSRQSCWNGNYIGFIENLLKSVRKICVEKQTCTTALLNSI